MNEILKMFLPYIVTFLAGSIVSGGLSGITIHNSASDRITELEEQNAELARTNQEIGDLNTQLKDTVARDAEIKQKLASTIRKQQEDLDRANGYIEQAGEANKLAGDYTGEAIDDIDRLISRYRQNGSDDRTVEEDNAL